MAASSAQPSFLATRRGKFTLVLLAAVGFLDFVDASIVNIALPHIRSDLHFSVQDLQWVLSGYLLTYGGFLLVGGRLGDLFRPPPASRQRKLWVQVAKRSAAAQRRDMEMRDAA